MPNRSGIIRVIRVAVASIPGVILRLSEIHLFRSRNSRRIEDSRQQGIRVGRIGLIIRAFRKHTVDVHSVEIAVSVRILSQYIEENEIRTSRRRRRLVEKTVRVGVSHITHVMHHITRINLCRNRIRKCSLEHRNRAERHTELRDGDRMIRFYLFRILNGLVL